MTARALLAAGLALALAGAVRADDAAPRLALGDAVKSVRLSGELTLRDESIIRNQPGQYSQHRERYRYRLMLDTQLPDAFTINLRLASGTGSQVASYQTLGKLSGEKAIWIDRIEARWSPELIKDGAFSIGAGRMEDPLWRTYAYDILYDPDFMPEGAGERVEYALADAGVTVFANAFQAVVDEDTATAHARWLFAQQAGADLPLPLESRLRVAGGYHKWSAEDSGVFNETTVLPGNRRVGTTNKLANRFGVAEAQAELKTRAAGLPLSVSGVVSRNVRGLGELPGGRQRDGYHFGFVLGAAQKKGTWELGAFRRWTQADNQVSSVSDSEFGEGGTNRQGFAAWVAYAPRDWLRAGVKYYYTKTLDDALPPGPGVTNRLQVDWLMRF